MLLNGVFIFSEETKVEDEINKIDGEEDIVPELDTTLYIKNISFDTDETGIKKVRLIVCGFR